MPWKLESNFWALREGDRDEHSYRGAGPSFVGSAVVLASVPIVAEKRVISTHPRSSD
jgi:hypothetical protein